MLEWKFFSYKKSLGTKLNQVWTLISHFGRFGKFSLNFHLENCANPNKKTPNKNIICALKTVVLQIFGCSLLQKSDKFGGFMLYYNMLSHCA